MKRRRSWRWFAIGALACVFVGGIAWQVLREDRSHPFPEADAAAERLESDTGALSGSNRVNRSGAQPVASAVGAPVPSAPPTNDTRALIRWAADTSTPLEARLQAIAALSARGDDEAAGMLMEIGSAGLYLSCAAVEGLGNYRGSGRKAAVRAYLLARLEDRDPQMARAAIVAWAQWMGRDGTASLLDALARNRERPDGYGTILCTAIVRHLGTSRDASATPALAAELDRVGQGVWGLEYGAEVVEALGSIGGAASLTAVERYVNRLVRETPDDKMAKHYYEEMIRKARAVAGAGGGKD